MNRSKTWDSHCSPLPRLTLLINWHSILSQTRHRTLVSQWKYRLPGTILFYCNFWLSYRFFISASVFPCLFPFAPLLLSLLQPGWAPAHVKGIIPLLSPHMTETSQSEPGIVGAQESPVTSSTATKHCKGWLEKNRLNLSWNSFPST